MINKTLAYKIFEGFSIQRWNDLVRPFEIVEMDKAGEKVMIAYIIAKYEENDGKFIDWEWLVYASIFDLLRKISLCDIKAPVQRLLKKEYLHEYIRLDEWVLSQYKNILDKDLFSRFTIYLGQKAGTLPIPEKSVLASRVFNAAHKYSTVRELEMISPANEVFRLGKIKKELEEELQPYLDLRGLQMFVTHSRSFEFLMKLEQLRFQTRWNQTPRVPHTSVIGHSFFVAAVTFLLGRSSEKNCDFKMCSKRMTNNFFAAIFHDLPEAVTRDIISPVKQATDELPSIVKKIEDEIVEKELLPLMESFYVNEILYFTSDEFSNKIVKDGKACEVTFEEINASFNADEFSPVDGKLIRVADHLSALMEADVSIKHGITSPHLVNGRKGMISHYKKGELINGIDAGQMFEDIVKNEN